MWVFRGFSTSLIVAMMISISANAQNFDKIISVLEKADTTSNQVRIELKNSNELYVGSLISFSQSDVTIEISAGTITIGFEKIDEIRVVYSNIREDFWFSNHSRNRLFIYPTAIANETGTGYYQNIYIVLSNVSYTPIKGLSVNILFNFTPFVVFDSRLFAIGAKYSLSPIKDFHIAVSATRYSDVLDDDQRITTFSTLGTYSFKRTDFSFGLGYGTSGNDISDPVALFGLQSRITQRLVIVTENFILPGVDSPIYSIGPRFLGKRISADLGFFFHLESEEYLPFVSFSTAF